MIFCSRRFLHFLLPFALAVTRQIRPQVVLGDVGPAPCERFVDRLFSCHLFGVHVPGQFHLGMLQGVRDEVDRLVPGGDTVALLPGLLVERDVVGNETQVEEV